MSRRSSKVIDRHRAARLLAAMLLPTLTACRSGPCPPDTEPRGSPQAGQQTCEYQDSNGVAVKHGPFTDWYSSGRKKSEGSYQQGKQDGHWTYWDEAGRKTAEREYRSGEVASQKTF